MSAALLHRTSPLNWRDRLSAGLSEGLRRVRAWFDPDLDETLDCGPRLVFLSEVSGALRAQGERADARCGLGGLMSFRRRTAVLELPADDVLEQKLRLPRPVAENLKTALRHNISTWSPFSADEVFVRAGVHWSSPGSAIVPVTIRYALRGNVAPAIESARVDGWRVVAIALDGKSWLAPLDEAAATRRILQERLRRYALVAAGALALVALAAVLLRIDVSVERYRSARPQIISELRKVTDAARASERHLAAIEYVKSRGAERLGSTLALLAGAIPPDIAPRAVTFELGKATIAVTSDAVEALEQALRRNPALKDVTRVPSSLPGLFAVQVGFGAEARR